MHKKKLLLFLIDGLACPAHGNAVKETEIQVLLPLPHTHSLMLILVGYGMVAKLN